MEETMPPQQFCVRWNSYQSNLQNAFPKLLVSEHFVDVTLACENKMIKCHKVVLSACSTYFEQLLLNNPCQHPIIFMKDMKFHEMQSLVDFMYKGEVNVTQDELPSLIASAEALQIRGLCGHDHSSFPFIKTQMKTEAVNGNDTPAKITTPVIQKAQTNVVPFQQLQQTPRIAVKKEFAEQQETVDNNQSSSDCDSNDMVPPQRDHEYVKEESEAYYEPDTDLMDSMLEEDGSTININANELDKSLDFAIANVSCQYDGSPGSASKRVRRSDEELRRAAECITRGQTFQTVSDQFNIPISTIRFYMARKGILPRRKRGRSCAGPMVAAGVPVTPNYNNATGTTSPIGPPFHIVHYKLPPLGVSPKLK